MRRDIRQRRRNGQGRDKERLERQQKGREKEENTRPGRREHERHDHTAGFVHVSSGAGDPVRAESGLCQVLLVRI